MEANEVLAWQALVVALAFAILVAAILPLLSSLLGPRDPNKTKLEPYECGIVPFDEAQGPVSVRFGLIAMLFLLFDIEIVFLYPWAAASGHLGLFALVLALVFMLVLDVGFWWLWKRGAFAWEK